MKNPPPGVSSDHRYRTVNEKHIVDILLVAAFVYELEAGERERAAAQIRSALDAWIKLGLGFRSSDRGERMFDPVEIINRMKWSGYLGRDNFWENHFVATARNFFSEWNSVARGTSLPDHLVPRRFGVTMRRTFNLVGIEPGHKLRLRLPMPLSQSSENLHVEPIASEDLAARVVRSEGRLDFQFLCPSNPEVDIAAKMTFTTDGRSRDDLPGFLTSDKRDIYLRASEGLIRTTPRIRDLSQTLAGSAQDELQTAKRFFHYIIDELMCGMVHYDQVNPDAPGDWVLDSGWYDCQLGSALFVSLCRASGIPARILSGHMLYRLAPGFHYWAEVWIDERGWTPFDFLTWDLSKGGNDEGWRDSFAGNIDYRMVTQCYPFVFTGPMSVRFPSAWHLVNAPLPRGMDISFTELDGKLIYRDQVTSKEHPF